MLSPPSRIEDLILTEAETELMTLDNSIMNVFSLCPRKFLYRKILSLVPKQEALPLTYGSAAHAALEAHYSGKNAVEVLKAFVEAAQQEKSKIRIRKSEAKEEGVKEEYSIEFGMDLMAKYMSHYPTEAETFKVKLSEDNEPLLEVGFSLYMANGIVVGKLDGIIDDGDLLEHKTTTQPLTTTYLSQFTVHNQISLYMAATRELMKRKPKKCLVNCIRVKDYKKSNADKDNKLFTRVVVQRSDAQLDQTLKQVEMKISQIKNFCRVGFDAFYQNAPDACFYKWVPCEYLPLCTAQNQEMIEMLMDGGFREEVWHPYDKDGAKKEVKLEVFDA